MEEDIKVLEEIKNHQVAFFDPIQQKEILKYYLKEEQRQAIENLIKRNKELEVINKMQEYRISVIDERELIPKSKVREIIDTKFISLFEGNTEFSDKGTKMKYVRYVKVSDIEKLLQEGDDK